MQEKMVYTEQCAGQVQKAWENRLYDLEAAREKLYLLAKHYGMTNPLTLRQSKLVDNLILLQMKKRRN
ncbi:MAG: aspartyl-phosphate phosphatase Spo0E family protein [Bacillota bacterium]|nr:aspartyl-phosphate phosphatase Spo0E family protein [Bacillota bacterium]MDW7682873.1 aspartyl-phosphate phosphatase Spo0E family protein [Bacillota bacterium]